MLSTGRTRALPDFDVLVVGGGHAGIEAALASARLGCRTACITLSKAKIGHLPCNCSIGGPAKGHMAREVDALGGQMGISADLAATHIRRVATGKGPSVRTIRAHVCKDLYPRLMSRCLETTPNLVVIESAVESVQVVGNRLSGVVLADGSIIRASCVVLTTGTFLSSVCHTGKIQTAESRVGELTTYGLSQFLGAIGVRLKRFKTGTTPRIRLHSIDLSRCSVMEPEQNCGTFSYLHTELPVQRDLLPCYQTRTTEVTHDFIRDHLSESAMFSGAITGIGPRYCPSVEDKVVKFAEKTSHPIFLEIETWDGPEVYVQGFSTSLPADVQLSALKTIPGLEQVEMIRPGYAVEYDVADPTQLTPQLMSRQMDGLFLAGQLNGTSGYEEAAGQGIVAGIQAARYAQNKPWVEFSRANSFIGVMVDDLVTKGVDDPYRMLTARAEHRLHLRNDNADARLTPIAIEVGLADPIRTERFYQKQESIAKGKQVLENIEVHAGHEPFLSEQGESPVSDKISLLDLMRRPSMNFLKAQKLAELIGTPMIETFPREVIEQIELGALYKGYLAIQERQVKSTEALDAIKIPSAFDYEAIPSLSYESREKLGNQRPQTVGQALRIPGIRVTDVLLVMGRIKALKKESFSSAGATEREPASHIHSRFP